MVTNKKIFWLSWFKFDWLNASKKKASTSIFCICCSSKRDKNYRCWRWKRPVRHFMREMYSLYYYLPLGCNRLHQMTGVLKKINLCVEISPPLYKHLNCQGVDLCQCWEHTWGRQKSRLHTNIRKLAAPLNCHHCCPSKGESYLYHKKGQP